MQILQDQNFIKKLCSMWDFYIIEGGRIERLAGNWPWKQPVTWPCRYKNLRHIDEMCLMQVRSDAGLRPSPPCIDLIIVYAEFSLTAWLNFHLKHRIVFAGRSFGQERPPLTDLLKNILLRYPDGGQILKVSFEFFSRYKEYASYATIKPCISLD